MARILRILGSCLLLAAAFLSCGPTPPASVHRIAILHFENLTPDPALDWVGRAASGILASQITGNREAAFEVPALRDATARRASQVVQGYYGYLHGDLRLTATIEEADTNRITESYTVSGKLSAGIAPLIDRLAREIDNDVKAYATKNETAIREYFQALEAGTPDELLKRTAAAIAADPLFAAPYITRTQALIAGGDPAAARSALAQAVPHAKDFSDLDRARLEWLRVTLDGNPDKRAHALEQLARFSPADVEVWRNLAELQMMRKQPARSVAAYERAVTLEPDNTALWNQLAYARALKGDLSGAMTALEEYRSISPADPNALDSMAEVQFLSGNFAQAGKFFLEAHQKNPSVLNGAELYRAAVAAHLAGQEKQAADHWLRYADAHPNDPLLAVRRAVYLYTSGKEREAERALADVIRDNDTNSEVRSIALAQQAIWFYRRHDISSATGSAQAALKSANTPGGKNAATIALLLGKPDHPGLPANLRAYALLFAKRFDEAVAAWQKIYDATPATLASDARVMLLWAKQGNDGNLRRFYPLPPQQPEPGLSSLTLPVYLNYRKP